MVDDDGGGGLLVGNHKRPIFLALVTQAEVKCVLVLNGGGHGLVIFPVGSLAFFFGRIFLLVFIFPFLLNMDKGLRDHHDRLTNSGKLPFGPPPG